MRVVMSINDHDIEEFGLTASEGTLNALMKPAPFKKMTSNKNSSTHGSSYISSPDSRYKDERSFALPFYLRGESLIDTQRRLDNLVQFLIDGQMENSRQTGINEVYVPALEKTYRLIYDDTSKFSLFTTDGGVLISIKFIEFDPSNRERY